MFDRGQAVRHNIERVSPKDHHSQAWENLGSVVSKEDFICDF